jgi:hypothetical protein
MPYINPSIRASRAAEPKTIHHNLSDAVYWIDSRREGSFGSTLKLLPYLHTSKGE